MGLDLYTIDYISHMSGGLNTTLDLQIRKYDRFYSWSISDAYVGFECIEQGSE
jgi:hypothetical protein